MGDKKDYNTLAQLGLASTIGIILVASTAVGYFFGAWLDTKLGWSPWMMLLFTVLGVAAGLKEMIQIVVRLSK